MRTELGLILKHVTGGIKKVNVVNYCTKPPLPADDYYHEEDIYAVNNPTPRFTTKRPTI